MTINSSQDHKANQEKVVAESEMESDDVENNADEVESEDSHRGLAWVLVIIGKFKIEVQFLSAEG